MTESPNNQRRRPGQARGLRARNRPRNGDNQNNQQRQNNQQSRAPQANRQRKNDNAKNGAKPTQRRKQNRQRTPNNKLDSELDFRLSRPSSLQQQAHSHHDEGVLFSQTQANGNGKGRGRTVRNGQQWTPSDGGIYLHELRGSDWYREDQARYAAKQIALENAERRQAESERSANGEASQARRPASKPRNNRNQRPRQNNATRRPSETKPVGSVATSDTNTDTQATCAPVASPDPAVSVKTEETQAQAVNGTTTEKKSASAAPKPKAARKTSPAGAAKKVTRKRKPVEKKDSDTE